MGKKIFFWISGFGCGGDGGAARVGKTKNFGDFIETFADGIIESGADDFKLIMVFHANDLSMTSRDDEGEKRERRFGRGV